MSQIKKRSDLPTMITRYDAPEDPTFDDDEDEGEDSSAEDGLSPEESTDDTPETADALLPTLERALSPYDPLKQYLTEASRYPLLSPEEEIALVQKMREDGDIEAAKRLVTANLRLVVKIAFDYRTVYQNVMDLIQEGNVGLMKAVSKFDPTKGARLGYYASWWIRSYILKYILDNFRLVKVGTTQAQKKLFYRLMQEQRKLEAQGMLAGPKLLAEKLDVKEEEVLEMQQRLSSSGAEMPLDAPIHSTDGRVTHLDALEDTSIESADDTLARDELISKLEAHLPAFQEDLNEKEKRVLMERLLADEPKTLQEIADAYGLSRERVRQIESQLMKKLKKFLGPILELDESEES